MDTIARIISDVNSLMSESRDGKKGIWEGLKDLGLKLNVPADHRLPTLTTVQVPGGVNVVLLLSALERLPR